MVRYPATIDALPVARSESARTLPHALRTLKLVVVVLPCLAPQPITLRKQRDEVALEVGSGFLLTLFTRS